MKNFLAKLKKEGSLVLVEPSEEISESLLIKSNKCLRVAQLAYDAGIYENAVSEAYYAIYNTVMSLFFERITTAQKFNAELRAHMGSLTRQDIDSIRLRFEKT
jgi:uncharacterized protein (UPF0332 family)